jgi:serine/threonine-protein kinase
MSEGACFPEELSVLIGMEHPHLVKLLDVIAGPPQIVITCLFQHGTLSTLLHSSQNKSRLTNLSLRARINAVMQVGIALDSLHNMQVVHRDVAAESCFLSGPVSDDSADILEVPAIKLGSFGLARTVDYKMSTFVGSVRYMSPEVMQSGSYGLLVDIFSCGILLHEAITGSLPYHDCEQQHLLALRILHGLRPNIELIPEKAAGAELRSIIQSSWSHNPSDRPSAAALLASMRQCVDYLDTS